MLKDRPHHLEDSSVVSGELAGHPMSDVAWVVNEAARLAARSKKDTIGEEELREALDRLRRTGH
jgi:cell division protease FtsH